MKVTDKQFDILIGVLYLLPIPVMWLIFPPSSMFFGVFYVAVTVLGLWEAYQSFRSAYAPARGGKG